MDAVMLHELLSYLIPGIVVLALGAPFARVLAKRLEPRAPTSAPGGLDDLTARLERIETAVDAIAIEVERISEAQRYVVRAAAGSGPAVLPSAPRSAPPPPR